MGETMTIIDSNKGNYVKVDSEACLVISGMDHLFQVVMQLGGDIRIASKVTGQRFEVKAIQQKEGET